MRTGMIITLLSSFHSRLVCIWGEASAYVMANTRSFMIFLFQVYWIDAFGIWSDTNHYIYIVLYVILSKLRRLAYAMMTYFSEPTIQSYFLHLTANWKKTAVRALCFSSALLYYALVLKKNLVSGTLWCNQSPVFSPLVPFLQFLVFSVTVANCSDISLSWAIWHIDSHGPLHVYCRLCYS
jgi:hypothetical protein